MLKHSLLQHEEKGPNTLQGSNRKHHSTTTLQSGYLHEGKLLKLITPITMKVTP
jgi:hypothetical protein